ncbi:DUF5719 family protein [Nocardioides montaniterrae]
MTEPTEPTEPIEPTEPKRPRFSRRASHNAAAPGRRAEDGGRRVDLLVALAVGLPAVVALGVAAVGDRHTEPGGSLPPVSSNLTSATMACPPPAAHHAGPILVARAPKVAGGTVQIQADGRHGKLGRNVPAQVDAGSSRPRSFPAGTATILTASGDAAPGLVAGRRDASAAPACTPPSYDEWYVGLGASASNDSVITLSNPDGGQAVVDIELIGMQGPIEAESLRGMVVPGHTVLTVDLAHQSPTRATFAAHVVVSRGRAGISVQHRYDRLGGAPVLTDVVPPQLTASTSNLLLGASVGDRALYLANPGDSQAEATVRVLNNDSVFTPTGSQPVDVPPQTVVRVPLDKAVPKSAVKGMLGLVVESDLPLLGTTRGVAGDLSVVGASPTITAPTAAIVPDAPTRLLLGGALRAGTIHVSVLDARGKVLLADKAISISAGRGAALTLPKKAAVVTIDPRNTSIAASLAVAEAKARTVVPVRDTTVHAEVPAVHPR